MSLDGDDEKLINDDLQSDDSYATYDKKKKKGATAGGATAGGAADGAEGESKGFSKKCKIVTGVAVVLVILVIALVLIIGALKPKVPDAPASLTRNDELTSTTEVAFSWEAPTDNGGEEVIDYTVQMMTGEEGSFSDQSTGQNQTSFKLDTGISAGKTYTFRVRARNSVGFSDYSSELPIIAATTPKASPSDVANDRTQTATNQVTISWEAPSKSGDGGSPIIDYTVEQLDEQTGNFTAIQSGLTTTSCTISDLTEGTSYTFRVRAGNAVGLGEPSSEVTIATLMGEIGEFYLSGLAVGDSYSVYVNAQELFTYKGNEKVNGTYVRNKLQSFVTGDDQVTSILFQYVGCQIEAMNNLMLSILSYNTEDNQLSQLELQGPSLFGTGNFTDLYDQTLNVTELRYEITFEDASQKTNALFELASQITENSTNMTTVVMTEVQFNATEFEAVVSNVKTHQMQSIAEIQLSMANSTKDFITKDTMIAAADILAQAPELFDIQIGDIYINGYNFDVSTDDEVDVMPDDVSEPVYTASTSKTHEQLCAVTIIPCLNLAGEPDACNANEWCGDEPTPTKNNDWSQAIRGELDAIFAN